MNILVHPSRGKAMGESEVPVTPSGHSDTEVSQSTLVPGENITLTEPRWTSPHDTHVTWPSDWTNDQKVDWLLKEFHLFPPAQRQAASMYAGPYTATDGFDWNSYEPGDHVLVHKSTFFMFLSWGEEADALKKGMKTINRKRRKANAVQRRTERRLAQARSGREQLRSKLVESEREVDRYVGRLTASRSVVTAYRQAHDAMQNYDNEVIGGLNAKIRELEAELEVAKAKASGYTDANNAADAAADGDGAAWTMANINTALEELPSREEIIYPSSGTTSV
jgi:hypothetical protein